MPISQGWINILAAGAGRCVVEAAAAMRGEARGTCAKGRMPPVAAGVEGGAFFKLLRGVAVRSAWGVSRRLGVGLVGKGERWRCEWWLLCGLVCWVLREVLRTV